MSRDYHLCAEDTSDKTSPEKPGAPAVSTEPDSFSPGETISEEQQARLDTLSDLMNYTCHFVHHYSGRRGQGKILGLLSRQGPMTQHDLQDQLCIQSGSASEILSKLENAGFIIRTRDEKDRRRCIISITDAGREDLKEHDQLRLRKQGLLYRDLTANEQEELIRILQKLHAGWEKLPSEKGHRGKHPPVRHPAG